MAGTANSNDMTMPPRALYTKDELLGRQWPSVLEYSIVVGSLNWKRKAERVVLRYDQHAGRARLNNKSFHPRMVLFKNVSARRPEWLMLDSSQHTVYHAIAVRNATVDGDGDDRAAVGTLLVPLLQFHGLAAMPEFDGDDGIGAHNDDDIDDVLAGIENHLTSSWHDNDGTLVPAINRMLYEYENGGLTGTVQLVASNWLRPVKGVLPDWARFSSGKYAINRDADADA